MSQRLNNNGLRPLCIRYIGPTDLLEFINKVTNCRLVELNLGTTEVTKCYLV